MFKVIMNLLLHRRLRAGEVVLRINLVISSIATGLYALCVDCGVAPLNVHVRL